MAQHVPTNPPLPLDAQGQVLSMESWRAWLEARRQEADEQRRASERAQWRQVMLEQFRL
jgi:hypothetical protein